MNINECWYKDICNETCSQSCIRFNSMVALCEKSNLPKDKWKPQELVAYNNDLENFRKLSVIKKDIVEFVKGGNNLYIYSTQCGNGKTSWSIKLLLAYFNQIWYKSAFDCKGIFMPVYTFLSENKMNIGKPSEKWEYIRVQLEKCDIVVWDDIASTKLSEYDYQILLSVIDKRLNEGKSNIFTANCGKDECLQHLGPRLFSRVFNASIPIELVEGDKRGWKYD